MSEPFLGEIRMFGFNFPPRGWSLCNGQLLPISQNTALFSILGTTFGGDGKTTFALPNLQGNAPMHPGTGPGLTPRSLGEDGGEEAVTLTTNTIPSHNHIPLAKSGAGTQYAPSGTVWAADAAGAPFYATTPNTAMNASIMGSVGGGLPHANLQPYLAVNFCIALQGVFPPRG